SLLKRTFKEFYNISVSDFVHQHAMNNGHYLLTTTRKTIDEIAEELGYAWRPAFEQAFKKFFNYSPSSLRNDLNS
ncbi:MAG TPA: helix-turn-helix domain-containing protein, partial [Nitrosopumilaceae archaeon]|nr:helix-turn-helix domain-containing protein [Nitrosopumilaceae archaeon]